MRLLLGFFLVFLSTWQHTYAQSTSKFQVWTDFNPSYKLNDKWSIGGDIGYRFTTSDNGQTAYVRPVLGFKANKTFSFAAGVANFNSWEKSKFIRAEIRTFEFVLISWPNISGFTFRHRLGVEQRWQFLPDYDLSDFVNRGRYYLELKSPDFPLFKLKSLFYVMANFELLRDLNKNELGRLADHNRYTIGVGSQITENFKTELRFKIINTVDPLVKNYIREISVVRIRLYYRFTST